MSHYTVNYKDLPKEEAHQKAISDIIDWLGKERYDKISENFRAEGFMSLKHFTFYCGISGVQGFPVQAWYEELFGDVIEAKANAS